MHLQISGKNIDVGSALRTQVDERLTGALKKYFDGGWSAQVTVEREGTGFRTECRVHLDSGIDLKARGQAGDAYLSFDQAADRLEKRLRRYKRRLKDHHGEGAGEPLAAIDYTIAAEVEESDDESAAIEDNPVVIAETQTNIRWMTVGMAVMAMDLAEAPVMVFRNTANGRLNIVYRRADGNIGWMDPPLESGNQDARN